MKPTIIIDDKIPFIKGVFDNRANVIYLNGNEIKAENIKYADALIIRTRTRCDEHLLKNSSIKYIATATIGFDHIDADYCQKHGIQWKNSPGCNAGSVMQYIVSALFSMQNNSKPAEKTIGIVGVGNVGKLVAAFCQTIGMKVLLYDPPRQRTEKNVVFNSLDEILQESDIITFHTPLNMDGEDKTFHFADKDFFGRLKRKPLIINSARGEICDTEALKTARKQNLISGIVLDCWENEPNIDLALLEMCDISTPHIAGYSADGKANATTACVQYISKAFDLNLDDWTAKNIPPPSSPIIEIDNSIEKNVLAEAVLSTYNVKEDSEKLKNNPQDFEFFRNHYPVRREFSSYSVSLKNPDSKMEILLKKVGFI